MNPKWIDLTALQNPKSKLRSLLPVVILAALLVLIPIGIYLVKQPQIFKPKAQFQEGPSLYLKPAYHNLNYPIGVGEELQVNVIADSQGQIVNSVDAKLNFDKNLLEVVSINTTGVNPPYCGGIAGIQCPAGYSCLIDQQEGIADAMGTCVNTISDKGNPKLASVLNQLIKSESRQDLIRDYSLYVIDGKVRAVLELKNKDFSLPAEFGTEEARYETLLQALVFIDKLNQLTENPDINFIKAPDLATTNSNLDTQVFRRSLPPSITDVTPTPGAACKRTGCSGTICSDQDVVSTCEYREEYACYAQAQCERQSNGQCGWTMTESLSSCLGKSGTKPEGERCDDNPYSCKQGLECRPICEPTPEGAVCNAVGSICKLPKVNNQVVINAKYDNSLGTINLTGESASGATLHSTILAKIYFKALKPGKTRVDVDAASVFLHTGSNILVNKSGLDIEIEQLQTCGGDNGCQQGYFCDSENMTKYCAVNDCPTNGGFCRRKPGPPNGKGDGNKDGTIDWADLSVLYSNFFKNKPELDFNDDGVVNSVDYALLTQIFKEKGIIKGNNSACAEVITRACGTVYNDCKPGEDHACEPSEWSNRPACKDFPTPCDVPVGWDIEK